MTAARAQLSESQEVTSPASGVRGISSVPGNPLIRYGQRCPRQHAWSADRPALLLQAGVRRT